MISHMLFVSIILTSLAGAALAVMLDRRPSCLLVPYAAAALSSALAIIMSLTVLLGHEDFVLSLPTYVQRLGEFSLRVDNLSAYFLLVAAIVTMCVSAYSVGYLREYRGRYSLGRMGFLFNIFVLSLFMVFTAGNAVLFLIVWEIMSVSSYLLVMYEWRKEDSVSSGLLYLVMTHVGTAFIAAAFMLMWTQTGSFDFSSFAGIREMEEVSGSMRSAIFLLLLVGFGTKAGLVPLHIWLPRAHPAAPSNISALMSAIMVKTAVYMIVRCCFGFLGVTEVWWGLLVLLIACISALIGVLYAIVETDIKRVLAYSTVENMGIIFIGIGAAMVFQAFANEGPATSPYLGDIAALALVAALFHVMSHAMFKSLLFMGAGAVISSSHTRNIEEMGGIGRRMRYTGALFLVGALSISAIPPLNGFVGEWMLFQSLFLSQTIGDPMVNILIPAAVAALALNERLTGSRLLRSVNTIGGVNRDIGRDDAAKLLSRLVDLRLRFDRLATTMLSSATMLDRVEGTGRLSPENARMLGCVGPIARASGMDMDTRRDHPYAAYRDMSFRVPVQGSGDVYARTLVRIDEIRESFAIIEQALDGMPGGPIRTEVKEVPAGGTALSLVEAPRGELMYYVKAIGKLQLDRVKIRTPAFVNVPAVQAMLPGARLADVPVITVSLDPCICCTDR